MKSMSLSPGRTESEGLPSAKSITSAADTEAKAAPVQAPSVPIGPKHPPHSTMNPEPPIPCPSKDPLASPRDKYKVFTEHYSDVCTYINPDRDYETAKMLSIWGGLFGLDHFYLRSPTTGIIKTVVNMLTFGLWWLWDANQFVFEKEMVLRYGLSTLFDWSQGIGRGVLTEYKPDFVPKKDFLTLFVLAIFFGFLGLDRFYLGGNFYWQGWAKFLSCFILIGFLWVFFDIYQVLFRPSAILADGYLVPLPFTAMYPDWEKTPYNYIGDLFQVTMTPAEKAELDPTDSSSLSGLAKSGSLGKIGGLAKAAASGNPLAMASALKGAIPARERQEGGGGSKKESSGGLPATIVGATILGAAATGGFQLYKFLRG